jgi:predicted CXXCH cytochrome family protein
VHGDTRVGRLNLLSGGGACVDCHSEKEGPFIFPHPPVDRPGCISCHAPHGSTNPRLLTRRSISHLCLECHTDVPAFHDLGRTRYQDCQTCHAAVHGSNRDPRLIEE